MQEHDQTVSNSADMLPDKPPAKRGRPKRSWIVAGVVAVVVLGAGAGFWVWHEQPSFCNAVCHVPMDPYVEGYYADDPTLLASVHKGAQVGCLQCHQSNVAEQIAEGTSWLSGGYEVPLKQRAFDDAFCLNAACHQVSYEGLAAITKDQTYNPHASYHERQACSDCHKAHEASVNTCTACHADAPLPPNWQAYRAR